MVILKMKKIKTLNRIYSVILVMLFLFLCGCKSRGNGNENSSLDTTSYTLSFKERPFNNDEIDFGKVGTVSTGKIKNESNTQQVTVGEGRKVGDVIYKSINYNEIKAVWISYIDLENILKGRSEKDYTNNIEAAFKTCADLGINTVIFQVRPFGDALYESKLFRGHHMQAEAFRPHRDLIRSKLRLRQLTIMICLFMHG